MPTSISQFVRDFLHSFLQSDHQDNDCYLPVGPRSSRTADGSNKNDRLIRENLVTTTSPEARNRYNNSESQVIRVIIYTRMTRDLSISARSSE